MSIHKLYEKYFDNNDIYILEIQQKNIIVNYNYDGLLQLNDSLNIKKIIPINRGTTIYYLYKEFQGNHLLLYSPDQEQMTITNTNNNENQTIALSHLINEHTFSNIYYWKNNTLFLTTYDHMCYQICFITYTLKKISDNEVKKICPIFFNFWHTSKNYSIITSYPEQLSFLFKKDDTTIGFFNVEKNEKSLIQNLDSSWHDIEYFNNIFIFVYEKKLKIIHHDTQIVLQPDSGYIFLKAKFISATNMVILSSKANNHTDSLLQIYQFISEKL